MADLTQPSEFKAAFDAGQTLGRPNNAVSGQYVVVPEGHRVQSLNPIAWDRKAPVAAHTPNLADIASFTAYVNAFKTPATRVFADPDKRRFIGVIDYSEPGRADYCEHRASLQIKLHPDFETWQAMDGKAKPQSEFAQFVEENAPVFVTPNAATMRELSTDLQVSNEVAFQAGIRLQDGQTRLSYVENIQGRAGKSGEIVIPNMFTIQMPIFYGAKTEQIEAFFRYRVTGGKLNLWFNLYRVDETISNAFESAIGDVESITGIQVWRGLP